MKKKNTGSIFFKSIIICMVERAELITQASPSDAYAYSYNEMRLPVSALLNQPQRLLRTHMIPEVQKKIRNVSLHSRPKTPKSWGIPGRPKLPHCILLPIFGWGKRLLLLLRLVVPTSTHLLCRIPLRLQTPTTHGVSELFQTMRWWRCGGGGGKRLAMTLSFISCGQSVLEHELGWLIASGYLRSAQQRVETFPPI